MSNDGRHCSSLMKKASLMIKKRWNGGDPFNRVLRSTPTHGDGGAVMPTLRDFTAGEARPEGGTTVRQGRIILLPTIILACEGYRLRLIDTRVTIGASLRIQLAALCDRFSEGCLAGEYAGCQLFEGYSDARFIVCPAGLRTRMVYVSTGILFFLE